MFNTHSGNSVGGIRELATSLMRKTPDARMRRPSYNSLGRRDSRGHCFFINHRRRCVSGAATNRKERVCVRYGLDQGRAWTKSVAVQLRRAHTALT